MRGDNDPQRELMVTVTPEELVPRDHPIRIIKKIADEALGRLEPRLSALYAEKGRPSVPPEVLLKAQILIALYSVRSERLFCERLRYDFLFRWFLDLPGVGEAFDASTFSKNRGRLLEADIQTEFFYQVLEEARKRGFLSDDHFTVDGTLIEANASMKSFRKKGEGDSGGGTGGGRNAEVDFRGEKRRNATHASTTDPDARLFRKGAGQAAQLCYTASVLMENRNGLCVAAKTATATGRAERESALALLDERATPHKVTLGGDKGFDTRAFVEGLRQRGVVPHLSQNRSGRRSAIDGRTTRHGTYAVSQRVRKRVEEIFGWSKTVGGIAKTRFRGLIRVGAHVLTTLTAYNLVRISRLLAQPA